jgi:hypothetical protein
MDLYGLSPLAIAELSGVSIKTARRWKKNGHVPALAKRLIEITSSADLGHLEKAWKGFRIADGLLWTPERQKVSPGDIRAIQYRAEQLREYELELRRPKQLKLL